MPWLKRHQRLGRSLKRYLDEIHIEIFLMKDYIINFPLDLSHLRVARLRVGGSAWGLICLRDDGVTVRWCYKCCYTACYNKLCNREKRYRSTHIIMGNVQICLQNFSSFQHALVWICDLFIVVNSCNLLIPPYSEVPLLQVKMSFVQLQCIFCAVLSHNKNEARLLGNIDEG